MKSVHMNKTKIGISNAKPFLNPLISRSGKKSMLTTKDINKVKANKMQMDGARREDTNPNMR